MGYTINVPDGFEELGKIFERAIQQSANGKGSERHQVDGEPWHEQFICKKGLRAGNAGFAIGQASKKLDEGERMAPDSAVREFLGALVYGAAAIYTLETLHRNSVNAWLDKVEEAKAKKTSKRISDMRCCLSCGAMCDELTGCITCLREHGASR